MVATPRFSTAVAAAERTVQAELTAAERLFAETFRSVAEATRSRTREALEESGLQREARENIERLQLRLELLRNIRMNWNGFQKRMTAGGMTMRINQDAHLRHLVAFLETGKGVLLPGEDPPEEEPDPRRSMMTHEVQPTGAGKTGAFAIDIALMDVPSLTLVPLDPLLGQTKKDMVKIGGIPENDIGIVGGGTKDFDDKKHIVATYAGHMAMMRKGGPYAKFMKTKCKLVICDEVHYQAMGEGTQASIQAIDDDEGLINGDRTEQETEMIDAEREVLAHLEDETAVQSLKIGFTATPRASKKQVRQYFPQCLGRVYHRQMIEAGSVVPYKIIHCDGTIYEGDMEGYMSEEKEAEILQREGTYNKLAGEYAEALATYRKMKRGRKDYPLRGMTFCTNHDECTKFVREAEKFGLRCSIVTGREAYGKHSQEVIDAAMDALNANEIDLVVSVEKLAVGFNRPEINSIVWARLTSAAKTIQCIGRGGRSHTDDLGRVKKECLVFETNWTLKKDAKTKGRRPMRLADALAFNGEEPEHICSMANGSAIDYQSEHVLGTDGTVNIRGRLAIGIMTYANQLEPKMVPDVLRRKIAEAGLKVVPNVRVVGQERYGKEIDVYWKDEVDLLLPRYLNDKGVISLKGRDAVGIAAYAKHLKPAISANTIYDEMEAANIQPIPDLQIMSAERYGKLVDVYWKDEIDAVLPRYTNEKGIATVGDRQVIVVNTYGRHRDPPVSHTALQRYIDAAGLQPIEKPKVYSGKKPLPAYWKDEVEALIPMKVNDHGIVRIGGREAVSISSYRETLPRQPAYDTAMSRLTEASVKPVPNVTVLSGPRRVDVFWKDEVDKALEYYSKA